MKKIFKRFMPGLLVIAILLSVSITYIMATDAGTENDPLISLSYIEKTLLPTIYSYIDDKIGSSSSSPIVTSCFSPFDFTITPCIASGIVVH